VSSFSPEATTTNRLALALGFHWRRLVEARAFGSLFWPATIRSPFGDFRVNRAQFGVVAGPVLQLERLSLIPEAGFVAERLKRFETAPATGVHANQPAAMYRPGAMLALRLCLPLIRPVSAELAAGAAYFGRRAQFRATSAEPARLAEVWPVTVFAQLALDVATE
jgi:hypothetical protein